MSKDKTLRPVIFEWPAPCRRFFSTMVVRENRRVRNGGAVNDGDSEYVGSRGPVEFCKFEARHFKLGAKMELKLLLPISTEGRRAHS